MSMGIVDSFLLFLFGWRWFSEMPKEKRGLDHEEFTHRSIIFFLQWVIPFYADFYCLQSRKP